MDDQTTQPSAQRSMNPMIIAGVVALLLLLGGGIYFANQKSSSKGVMQQNTKVEATPTVVPTETTKQASPTASTAMKAIEVTVNGGNYYFKPNKITVKKGQEVKLTFANDGGFHDFVLDAFNVKTDTIGSGKSTTVTFTPDKTGTFAYYCSVSNHRAMGMTGTLVVE